MRANWYSSLTGVRFSTVTISVRSAGASETPTFGCPFSEASAAAALPAERRWRLPPCCLFLGGGTADSRSAVPRRAPAGSARSQRRCTTVRGVLSPPRTARVRCCPPPAQTITDDGGTSEPAFIWTRSAATNLAGSSTRLDGSWTAKMERKDKRVGKEQGWKGGRERLGGRRTRTPEDAPRSASAGCIHCRDQPGPPPLSRPPLSTSQRGAHLGELLALHILRLLGRKHAVDPTQADVLERLAVHFLREELDPHAPARVRAGGGDDLRRGREENRARNGVGRGRRGAVLGKGDARGGGGIGRRRTPLLLSARCAAESATHLPPRDERTIGTVQYSTRASCAGLVSRRT